MGLTYRKGMKLGPVRLSLSGSGVGYSVGLGGVRYGKSANGRAYKSVALPLGFRYQETLNKKGPKPKTRAKKGPWVPAKVFDLSGGDEFWLDIEGEENADAQASIAAAVAVAAKNGATEPIIEVGIARIAGSGLCAVVDSNKCVGVIPETDPRFVGLSRALVSQDAAGSCFALVFDEDGRLGLKLNMIRDAVDMKVTDAAPESSHAANVATGIALGAGVVGIFGALVGALFGRRRR